jgi:hypothetical protein
MSDFKGTSGPWKIDPILIKVKDGGSCPAYIRDQNDVIIADMNFNIPAGIGSNECTANAKLIAASPDMLDVLIEVKKHLLDKGYGPLDTVYARIIIAIEKATT